MTAAISFGVPSRVILRPSGVVMCAFAIYSASLNLPMTSLLEYNFRVKRLPIGIGTGSAPTHKAGGMRPSEMKSGAVA